MVLWVNRVSRIKALIFAFVWAFAIYFGKQRLLESSGHLALGSSVAVVVLFAASFMIPCGVFLVSILFGD